MKSRIEFLENAAKLLNITFKEAAVMSIGALTLRLSVMQEMREKDNKRHEETGRSGPWSDANRANEQFVRDLERATGERIDPQYRGVKAENPYPDDKTSVYEAGQWGYRERLMKQLQDQQAKTMAEYEAERSRVKHK